ncbi:DinB family protein [Pseudomonas sp. PCH199]|uniref:DinB family protein n=1 Tax=unclassified Pseudomonas TaxID=196821 RepID=UPI000BC99B1E|nr:MULTISPECIES: DinB family protein [unclassified Pseudomonas]MCW8278811.1 DinB family protein [Pseudomonas sp. PCH199]PAM80920.1 damage-inducible protein DinB [Pseudomonas sp. ERMR1:02]
MINVRTARMLADYKQWANRRLFDNLAQLPPGEVEKERAGIFKNMIGTLNHIYVVDCLWQAHLEGRGHGFTTSHDLIYPALADLRSAQQNVDHWYCDWAARQTDASLDRPVRFTFISGESGTMSAGAMLLHVVNHSGYHRGWIIQMYFEIPAMPPMTDLPIYLRETDPKFHSLNAPAVEPTCAPLFASATNVLPDRYR